MKTISDITMLEFGIAVFGALFITILFTALVIVPWLDRGEDNDD